MKHEKNRFRTSTFLDLLNVLSNNILNNILNKNSKGMKVREGKWGGGGRGENPTGLQVPMDSKYCGPFESS